MSADRWRECPRCRKLAETNKESRRARLAKKYGKIDAAEFVRLTAEIEKPVKLEESLCEDYGVGLSEDGTEFGVSYSAVCQACDFKFQFRNDAKVQV